MIPQKYSPIQDIPLEAFAGLELYLIEPYDDSGEITILQISIDEDGVYSKVYNNELKPFLDQIEISKNFQEDIYLLSNLMRSIGVLESCFYYNKDMAIIEWYHKEGQFASFGMIYDFLSKVVKVPEIKTKLVLKAEDIKDILDLKYGEEIILRPNIFKTVTLDNKKLLLRSKWRKNE